MSLSRQVATGFFWVALNNFTVFVIALLANIILARLLDPSDFGVVALAEFFLLLLNRLKEMGFEYAMVHRQDQFLEVASVNFTLQLLLGLVIMVLGLVLSVVLGRFYGQVVGLSLAGLALAAPFKGISTAYSFVLDKTLQFQKNGLIAVISFFVMAAVAILLAGQGLGYLSLTFGYLPGVMLNTFLLWSVSPIRLRFSLDRKILRWFFGFGPWWHWLIASVAALAITHYDNFLIGSLAGTTVLGFYSRSYSFASLVSQKVADSFRRVLFPLFARFQTSRRFLSQLLNLQLGLVMRIVLPLVAAVLANVRELTLFLIGAKWLPLVPIFYAMILLMAAWPFFDAFGYFLIAVGRPRITNRIMIVQALFVLPAAWLGFFLFQEKGVALVMGLGLALGAFLLQRKVGLLVDLDYRRIGLNPFLATLGSLPIMLLAGKLWPDVGGYWLLAGVVVKLCLFALSYLLGLYWLERLTLISEVKALVKLELNSK